MLPETERLWVGTLGDGLYLLEGGRWERLGPLPPQTIPDDAEEEVECRPDDLVIALARVGNTLYAATYDHLYRFDVADRKWEVVGPADFAPRIREKPAPEHYSTGRRAAWCARGAFLIELDGSLWMPGRRGETEAGLYRLRAGTTQVERVPVDISPQCALAHEGYLWIGTAEGLVRLDPKTYRQRALSAREGYCGGNATALAVRGDTLWVASGLGVTRVTVAEFERRAKRVAPKGRAS